MSKIGKQPVEIPNGVTVEVNGTSVVVSGPKGKLSKDFDSVVKIAVADNETASAKVVNVSVTKNDKRSLAIWGTTRKLIDNMVKGVSTGWSKQLELVGTGYRSEVRGNTLVLTVGYSHTIDIVAPEGITFKVEKSVITVDGIDREVVGQVSADIRSTREPEPYKGKGVKYLNEVIRRKAGKAAKAAA